MTIKAVTSAHAADITRIAKANGLPESWVWPVGCYGGIAQIGDHIVAFCALRETVLDSTPLIAIEELWGEATTEGKRGLSELARHLETLAQLRAQKHGKVLVGGFVRREDMQEALKHRGYSTQSGELLVKTFLPIAEVA